MGRTADYLINADLFADLTGLSQLNCCCASDSTGYYSMYRLLYQDGGGIHLKEKLERYFLPMINPPSFQQHASLTTFQGATTYQPPIQDRSPM